MFSTCSESSSNISQKTVECIATALANICKYQDGLQRTFESDAVDKAKKLLLHPTAENPVSTGAEQATWSMLGALANDDDAKATCIEGGLVKLAADALERNVELAEGVIRFLLKISLCEAGKKAFVADGVVRAVSALLKSNIEYVREEAKLTICGASEYPATKREFVEAVLELGPDVVSCEFSGIDAPRTPLNFVMVIIAYKFSS